MLGMSERRMREAAVVHAPESTVAEPTAMEPATESAVETATKSATAAVRWPRKRKPAGCRQKCSRKPGTPGCA